MLMLRDGPSHATQALTGARRAPAAHVSYSLRRPQPYSLVASSRLAQQQTCWLNLADAKVVRGAGLLPCSPSLTFSLIAPPLPKTHLSGSPVMLARSSLSIALVATLASFFAAPPVAAKVTWGPTGVEHA